MFNKVKEENYFDMFINASEYCCKTANKVLDLVKNYTDVELKVKEIHSLEHSADKEFHKLYAQLMRSFITPIEREDILLLAQKIDNVTDYLEDISQRFVMFDVKELRSDVVPFVTLIVNACSHMKEALVEFKNFSKSKTIDDKILIVNDIEEEGDAFYQKAVRELFVSDIEAKQTLVWRELYLTMENCLDACEDVADAMNGVMLKNS